MRPWHPRSPLPLPQHCIPIPLGSPGRRMHLLGRNSCPGALLYAAPWNGYSDACWGSVLWMAVIVPLDREKQAQRGLVTCLRPYSQEYWGQNLDLRTVRAGSWSSETLLPSLFPEGLANIHPFEHPCIPQMFMNAPVLNPMSGALDTKPN